MKQLVSDILFKSLIAIVYFVFLFPIGILCRALGKDFLKLKKDNKVSTYWISKNPQGPPPQAMKRQF